MLRVMHLFIRQLTTISLIAAFISLGFAHKNMKPVMTPELVAYVAAGGSIADICGGDQYPDRTNTVNCEACRIADSLTVTQTCDPVATIDLERIQRWRFISKRLAQSQGLDPARLTRAPPYV